ncbi:MAG: type II toxin-antitoxin system PemK/MazF family toxin [Acidobacteriia bacterium]|nr:type II toxin-antitoxin system PemK/MazF family toxin [Terriglobia bacterium]
MNPARRGEVWLVDLGQPKGDHEQAGRRPAVILQTDDLSPLSTGGIPRAAYSSRSAESDPPLPAAVPASEIGGREALLKSRRRPRPSGV